MEVWELTFYVDPSGGGLKKKRKKGRKGGREEGSKEGSKEGMKDVMSAILVLLMKTSTCHVNKNITAMLWRDDG